MSWSSALQRGALLALLLALAGCGFQLAGQQSLPSGFETIAVDIEDTRSDVYLALERALAAQGVRIDRDSPNRLAISDIETGQRVLSVSARNIPREFEVFYTISYSFRRDRELLLERPAVTLTRDYIWDETQVLGKLREERRLRALIVDDLVDIILRQIASVA
ncbi:MAG: LPS assembly lipoprotein LptE [Pseudomonadota bacterium]